MMKNLGATTENSEVFDQAFQEVLATLFSSQINDSDNTIMSEPEEMNPKTTHDCSDNNSHGNAPALDLR